MDKKYYLNTPPLSRGGADGSSCLSLQIVLIIFILADHKFILFYSQYSFQGRGDLFRWIKTKMYWFLPYSIGVITVGNPAQSSKFHFKYPVTR